MACCFVAGTKVKTKSGWKPIEKIKKNDKVWSRNDKTGESGYKRVLQLFVTAPEKLVTMSYCRAKRTGGKSNVKTGSSSDDEDGSGSLTGTLTHPVWSETRQAWIDLGKLKVGEKLKLDDGTQTVVTALKFKTAPKGSKFTTYNFEVADWHTYFVAPSNAKATAKAVWVHNTGNPCGVQKINNRNPINSKYAGKMHPAGVKFKGTGYPDFSPHMAKEVKIKGLTGIRRIDNKFANQAANFGNSTKAPKGFTWHHVEDGITMQLVPAAIHDSVRHTGGVAFLKYIGVD